MKKLKKLTRRQMQVLANSGYDIMEWLLERQNHNSYTYVNRTTKELITLYYK